MNEIKISFDQKSYQTKPEGSEIARISSRVGKKD